MNNALENFPPNPVADREKSGPIGPVALTPAEASALIDCEAAIQHGLETFIDVGLKLAEIRDGKLYRAAYCSFEQYCEDRWEMTGRYARRVCAAAEVTQLLAKQGFDHVPETESQARPLTALPSGQAIEVWAEIIQTAPQGKVTARHVQDIVASKLATPPAATAHLVKSRVPNIQHSTFNTEHPTGRASRLQDQLGLAISGVRGLLDQIGTADSAAGGDVSGALYRLEKFREHLSRMEKLQESRI